MVDEHPSAKCIIECILRSGSNNKLFNKVNMTDKEKVSSFKSILQWFLAGIIALAITSAFVVLYNYSGTHIVNESGATDYRWQANQYKGNMTEGINWMKMDANGFNNLSADTTDISILLMGGSHMEAIQIPAEKNAGSLLNDMLKDAKVYNIGMSGHQIANCLDNLEAAVCEFKPSGYVIIQTGDLTLTDDIIIDLRDGLLEDIPSYDSGALYYMQKIPALKVIYKQLTDKITNDVKNVTPIVSKSGEPSLIGKFTNKSILLSSVMQDKRDFCAENGLRLVIVYTPLTALDENGNLERRDDSAWVEAFSGVCENAGIDFIDCFDAFKSNYEHNHEVPYGFSNSSMGSGHLNAAGHRVLAEQICDFLRGDK